MSKILAFDRSIAGEGGVARLMTRGNFSSQQNLLMLFIYLLLKSITMIQRIQSIWLFFATACIFALFLFPYLQVLNPDGTASLIKVTGVYQNIAGQQVQTQPFLAIGISTVILALLSFVTIFLYKDRKKQIMLCYVTIVLIIGYSFWIIQTAKGVLGPVELQAENLGIGTLLPSISILFLILAIRGMKKDDRLIKSADRLR